MNNDNNFPANAKTEIAVIGVILEFPKYLYKAMSKIDKESFSDGINYDMYEGILNLHNRGVQPDPIALMQELAKMGVRTPAHQLAVANAIGSGSPANFESYCDELKDLQIRRHLINYAQIISRDAYDQSQPILPVVEKTSSDLMNVLGSSGDKSTKTTKELIREVEKQITGAAEKEGVVGIPSGFTQVDSHFGGWQAGNLYILAARPAMGKTSLALNFAEGAAAAGRHVLFVSCEMTAVQLTIRRISKLTGLTYKEIEKAKDFDKKRWSEWNEAIKPIDRDDDCIHIEDELLQLSDIVMSILKFSMMYPKVLVIIDYLQLIEHTSKRSNTREGDVSEISKTLKNLAKRVKVPIIALSQLSREVEKRDKLKRPQLSDLRESGSLEQDAYAVMMLYRAEVYKIYTEKFKDNDVRSTINRARLIIVKNRNGKIGDILLNFYAHLMDFRNYTNPNYPEKSNLPDEIEAYKKDQEKGYHSTSSSDHPSIEDLPEDNEPPPF